MTDTLRKYTKQAEIKGMSLDRLDELTKYLDSGSVDGLMINFDSCSHDETFNCLVLTNSDELLRFISVLELRDTSF